MTYKKFLTLKLGDKIRDKRTGKVGIIAIFSTNEVYVDFNDGFMTSYARDDYYNLKEFKEELKNIEKVE